MIKTELYTNEIPRIYHDFSNIIGETYWLSPYKSINAAIKNNKLLREYLHSDNSIVLSLEKYTENIKKYRSIPDIVMHDRSHYPAVAFMAQSLSLISNATEKNKKSLIGRVRGALKNADAMRALRLELLAATHFVRNGYSVSWPEMDDSGTFDLLIEGIGDNGLEVECKSVSRDKGKKIHLYELLDFFKQAKNRIKDMSTNLKVGLSIIVTIPDRLPSKHSERSLLINQLCENILLHNNDPLDDGSTIRVSEFDFSEITDQINKKNLTLDIRIVEKITKTRNNAAMVYGGKSGGILLVIQSKKDDTFAESIFKDLNESAKKQLSGNRPALFLVGFNNISSEDLVSLHESDSTPGNYPSLIKIGVSKYLTGVSYDHVIGVSFISHDGTIPQVYGASSGGSSYTFSKQESQFWHSDFNNLFVFN